MKSASFFPENHNLARHLENLNTYTTCVPHTKLYLSEKDAVEVKEYRR